jgi:hypothetical protein
MHVGLSGSFGNLHVSQNLKHNTISTQIKDCNQFHQLINPKRSNDFRRNLNKNDLFYVDSRYKALIQPIELIVNNKMI